MSSKRNDLKDQRRKEAEKRNAAWAAHTPVEQLALLNSIHGVGVGALKQRLKIAKRITADVLAAELKVQEAEAKAAKKQK